MIGRNVGLAVIIMMLGGIGSAKASDKKRSIHAAEALQHCLKMKGEQQRLYCYDQAARKFSAPTFKGRLGKITKPFTLNKPQKLRFRSYGVIFVLYLRDEKGHVLQNLHIGGGGEDEYIIRKPGVYSLKIHGSASWEIWLEPIESLNEYSEDN